MLLYELLYTRKLSTQMNNKPCYMGNKTHDMTNNHNSYQMPNTNKQMNVW